MNERRHFQFRLATLFAVTFGAAVFTWAAMRFPVVVWLPLVVLWLAVYLVIVALLLYLVFAAYVFCLYLVLQAARLTRLVVAAGVDRLLQLGKRPSGVEPKAQSR